MAKAKPSKTKELPAPQKLDLGPYSLANVVLFLNKNFGLLLLCAGFFLGGLTVGALWTENRLLKKGGVTTTPTTQAQQAGQQQQQQPQISLDQVKALFKNSGIKLGDDKRKVLFVEFSDPSCPYCHIAAGKNPELNAQAGDRFKLAQDGGSYLAPVPEMRKLVEAGKASLVWKYSPGHGNGEMGAIAQFCANEKGKFWPVHDKLMSKEGYDLLNEQVKNDRTKAKELADFLSAEFNANDMQKCLESGKYDQQLKDDTALATQFGAQGTPAFFVNETNFPGAYNFTDMKPVVDAALK
jgi:protein-disulfide isomerase